MTTGGWIIMTLSVGFVTCLLGWCTIKVLSTPDSSKRLHGQIDINTHDLDA